MNKKALYIAGVVAALFTGGVMAGSIKVWSNGQTLTATDINGNFAHIHGLMVGGHGPRLVDGDVAANAAIATSKLAGSAGIANSWAELNGGCDAGTCSLARSWHTTSVVRTAMGSYTITPTALPAAAGICVAIPTEPLGTRVAACFCSYYNATTYHALCYDDGVSADVSFQYMIYTP